MHRQIRPASTFPPFSNRKICTSGNNSPSPPNDPSDSCSSTILISERSENCVRSERTICGQMRIVRREVLWQFHRVSRAAWGCGSLTGWAPPPRSNFLARRNPGARKISAWQEVRSSDRGYRSTSADDPLLLLSFLFCYNKSSYLTIAPRTIHFQLYQVI